MADTSQQQQQEELPQTNGAVDGLTEEEKSKMRPADIDADMREMERRKRVEMMMNSRLFREELERIIELQMKDGAGPSGLLQQISEMMGHQGARFNANVFKNSNCVVPINDIRGVESMGYAKGEKLLRCKLAAVFRLLDLYGWTQGVGGMITARLNQDQQHFLVNPYGLLYHEVTASSLVKVDMQGGLVEQGTTNFGVHIAGYQLHSTIHAARPDIKCIVHIATPSVTAISSIKCGLLPLGQESIVIGEVSSHHCVSGGNLDPEEREKLARNFGPINKVMLLTNRGALCCGETIEEAFFNVYNTVLACETQLKLMPLGVDNLSLVSDEARKAIYEASRKAPVPQHSSVAEPSALAEKLEKRWRIGGTEFEALMRMLDNAGFRTGYIYRNPLVKSEPPRPRNDVEVPPAVSSLGYLLEEEELYNKGLWKGGRKGTDRTRWLNSPNVYQKVEILETGTPDPKKITKWVSDGSPTHSSTPVKIEGALQFVPKNTNPKEFKQLQQQIKDYRRADKISAGPQSHILEGVTWEEAKKMQDATISGTGEQVVLVGAASKGIIQRGFQHNAMVYKAPYAKNPFDTITDQELDQYKKEVERKTKGDPYDESQSESEALSSFNISRATHESSTAKSPIQSPVSVTSETEEESRDEPRVLRIATKQVPAPSQPEVVLSDGLSGVSRLSSSRSNSSLEDICWPSQYNTCRLETARTQELARPEKPQLTEILSARQHFYKNYEERTIRKSCKEIENDEEKLAGMNETFNSDAGVISTKLENNIKKLIAKRQLRQEMETEVSKIKISKNADIDFAEKVNLPIECTIADVTVYNINQEHNQEHFYSTKVEIKVEEPNDSADNQSNNILNNTESSLDSTLKMTSDHEVENKELNERNSGDDVESSSNIEHNKNVEIYVKEVEFSIGDYNNEFLNVNLADYSEDFQNNNKNIFESRTTEIKNLAIIGDHNYNNDNNNIDEDDNKFLLDTDQTDCFDNCSNVNYNEQSTNFVSELELFIDNDSQCSHNDTVKENIQKITLEVSSVPNNVNMNNNRNSIKNFDTVELPSENETLEENTQESPLEVSIIPNNVDNNNRSLDGNLDTVEQSEKCVEELKSENEFPTHSTPLDTETIQNPLEVSLKIFLENEEKDSVSRSSGSNQEQEIINNSNEDNNLDKDFNFTMDSRNTNFIDDDAEDFNVSAPLNLDFTFSDIGRDSQCHSPVSTARESIYSDDDIVIKRISRCDSITEVVSSINIDIRPNKLMLDMLADTENSVKYNLDSQNMSRIYSITPPNDVGNCSKNTTITEDILGDYEENLENLKDNVDNEIDENEIWTELQQNMNKKEDLNMNITTEFSETSSLSNSSNHGSDILELPRQTYLDLQKTSDDTFHKTMSSSVNQIITELTETEVYVNAEHFVDKIIFDVTCLKFPENVDQYSKLELNKLIKEKIRGLNHARKVAKEVVRNSYHDFNNSSIPKVSINEEESDNVESLEQSIYTISELIHHIVDKDSLDTWDIKFKKTVTDKKVKETMNIELKSLKDDYDATDEKSLKCSTPKILLSPSRSRQNSFSEELIVDNSEPKKCEPIEDVEKDKNDEKDEENHELADNSVSTNSKSQQSLDTALSSNSSPSTESRNFAEQEITSESTDNDTKSDNSKEKPTDTSETLKNHSAASSEQSGSQFSIDFSDALNNNKREERVSLDGVQNKTYCVIEYDGDDSKRKRDGGSDSDESIDNFMCSFKDEDGINHMWLQNESKYEQIYTIERLEQINEMKKTVCDYEREIDRIHDVQTDVIFPFSGIEEQSTSFSFDSIDIDGSTQSHMQFDKVDECCPCYLSANNTMVLDNTKCQSLSPIREEPELESPKKTRPRECEIATSFEMLHAIFNESDLDISNGDNLETPNSTKTVEFLSCQNSVSMKSCDDFSASSTCSISEASERERNYNADISTNYGCNLTSVCIDDSTMSEEVISTNQTAENFADISNNNNDYDFAGSEFMSHSYETKEFMKLEVACSDSSNETHCAITKSSSC